MHSASSWSVVWSQQASNLKEIYGTAVESGVELAAKSHEKRGGSPYRVEVLSLTEVIVDTTPDAVECATAIALWKACGHSESEAVISFDGMRWRVVF